jgi:predicted nuclease with TOPRIM domain
MKDFYKFYSENQKEHTTSLRAELEDSVMRVIADNAKIVKEFQVINSRLEASILSLNGNMQTLDEKINDLKDEVD